MDTPSAYTFNLEHDILTEEMLSDALYACNKRAKNQRDIEREHTHWEDSPWGDGHWHRDAVGGKAHSNKEHFYSQKEKLLKIVEPVEIHIARTRTEPKAFPLRRVETYMYFLYYRVGGRGFHKPIDTTEEYISHNDIQTLDIGTLETSGANESTLIPEAFVDELLDALLKRTIVYLPKHGNAKILVSRHSLPFSFENVELLDKPVDFPIPNKMHGLDPYRRLLNTLRRDNVEFKRLRASDMTKRGENAVDNLKALAEGIYDEQTTSRSLGCIQSRVPVETMLAALATANDDPSMDILKARTIARYKATVKE